MVQTKLLQDLFFDGIQDAMIIIRVGEQGDYYYEMINHKAYELTGLSEENLGDKLTEKVPGISRVFVLDKFDEIVHTKQPYSFTMGFPQPNKETIALHVTLQPIELQESNFILVHARQMDYIEPAESQFWLDDQNLELSRQRYRSLFENNADAIFSLDLDGNFLEVNKAFEVLSGYKKCELIGNSAFSYIERKLQQILKKHFIKTIRGDAQVFELTVPVKSTVKKELHVTMTPLVIEEGFVGIYVIMKDVSEQRKAERELRESEERFRMIAESSHDLITLLDHDGNILYASPSYEFILGIHPDEYVGQSLLYNIHEEDKNKIISEFIRSINENVPITLEFKQRHTEKGWLWFELQGKPIFDVSGGFLHMVVVTREISERKKYEEKLRTLAYQDPLTNLPNRRYFQDRLSERLAEARRQDHSNFAVIMVDMDNLKELNDQYGHDFGDEALRVFSRRILNSLRSDDQVARLGGDEFIILLSHVKSKKDCVDVVKRLHNNIRKPIKIKGVTLTLTASMGLTMPKTLTFTEEEMIKQADKALYQAKQSGKNTYEVLLTADEEI
ncbi:sensor domain-containing diguanylate cyclase [Allobacillus halotolerans]|uniref:Sensor domain-containing diguanylate cyclase n=1 Tax=Allobacillus halotolerans TaxID=570278 RepID=A0ABS6GR77_9BACI|nr:sensor domain-containing diguanylate cyclase [Allobacillus halotolerans]MBU6081615.1 sensor domain-containing diguanylate cyclase [Allobacillus halotolerans]